MSRNLSAPGISCPSSFVSAGPRAVLRTPSAAASQSRPQARRAGPVAVLFALLGIGLLTLAVLHSRSRSDSPPAPKALREYAWWE